MDKHVSKPIIKAHASKWVALSCREKAAYERKAEEVRELRHKELQESIDEVRAKMVLQRRRMAEQSGLTQPMLMSSARLSAAQQKEFDIV